MLRIGQVESSATADGKYTDGSVAGGIAATRLRAAAFNAIQEELAHIVESTGVDLDVNDMTQVLTALKSIFTVNTDSMGALAALVGAANKLPYFTGPKAAALADLNAFAREILAQTDADGVLSKLGLGEAAKRDVGTGASQIPDMSAFTGSFSANGWARLPNGNIRQWGTVVASINDTDYRNFPIPFPNKCFVIVAGYSDFSSYGFGCAAAPTSKSQFIVSSRNSGGTLSNAKVSFIAEGY